MKKLYALSRIPSLLTPQKLKSAISKIRRRDVADAHAEPVFMDVKDNVSLTKFDKMTMGINLEGNGLEIGPSHSPMVPKRSGYNIEILDHAAASELKDKYQKLGVPHDLLENIEEVDYIWSGEELNELTGKHDYYDYIVASHVIEHTPDLVSFLNQCEKMLKPDGILSLAIPDKRYCFDYLRPNSTTGDVIQAFYDKRTRHTPGAVFDHTSLVAFRNGQHTWNANDTRPLEFCHDLNDAMDMANKSRTTNEYIDVHNWVFVPHSFRLILHDLNSIGLIDMSEEKFFDTEGFEFYILLKKGKKLQPINRMQYVTKAAGV